MNKIELRPEVQWFAEQMELTLRRNDHKGGWKDCDIDWLMERLEEEAKELFYSLQTPNSKESIISEATDVANFAMMIADIIQLTQEP